MRKIIAAAALAAIVLGVIVLVQPAPSGAAAPEPDKVHGEWRIRVKPDRGTEYGKLIQEKGLPLFREAGGRMVGWWTTLIGDLYEQVTIWEFDGMPGFEKAVGFLGKDARFKKFAELRDPLLSGEVSRFLKLAGGAAKPSLPEPAKFVIHEVHRVPLDRMEAYSQFAAQAIPALQKHGFRPVGPWSVAVGRWSEVTYLFLFESLAEREEKIAKLLAHEEGKRFAKRLGELAEEVTTRLLVPAPFAHEAR